jgi:hypothetical protein
MTLAEFRERVAEFFPKAMVWIPPGQAVVAVDMRVRFALAISEPGITEENTQEFAKRLILSSCAAAIENMALVEATDEVARESPGDLSEGDR